MKPVNRKQLAIRFIAGEITITQAAKQLETHRNNAGYAIANTLRKLVASGKYVLAEKRKA